MAETTPQIDEIAAEVNALAHALDCAELEGDPDLQPPRMPVHFNSYLGKSFIPPLVSDYWAVCRRRAERRTPCTDLKAARSHLASVQAGKKYHAERRREGYSGDSNMRHLIEIEVLCEFALRDVRAIEAKLERNESAAGVVWRIPRRKPRMRSE